MRGVASRHLTDVLVLPIANVNIGLTIPPMSCVDRHEHSNDAMGFTCLHVVDRGKGTMGLSGWLALAAAY